MTSPQERDRYITFDGLDCDANAIKLVERIKEHMSGPNCPAKWVDYLNKKFEEQQRMGVDDLFFVGSQMNALFAFFEDVGDSDGSEQLYQVEQECC